MSLLGEITRLLRDCGTDLAAEIYHLDLDVASIAECFGCSRPQATSYRRVARALFTPLSDTAAAQYRTRTLADARRFHLSLDALATINTQLATLAKDIDYPREQLRSEITAHCEGKSIEEIKQLATGRVRELNHHAATRPLGRAYRSQPNSFDMVHLNAYLNRSRNAAFFSAWGERTEYLYQREDATSYHHAAARALEEILAGGGKYVEQRIGVHAIVTTAELSGELKRDTVLLTSGDELPLAEILNTKLADTGWLVVHDHLSGLPERAFRIARHVNAKQRAMLTGHQVYCAAPGCTELAEHSQAHHITPWGKGGNTNIDNLVMLCRPHHAMVTHGQAELTREADGSYL